MLQIVANCRSEKPNRFARRSVASSHCSIAAQPAQVVLHLHDLLQILQEPRIDAGDLVDLVQRHAVLDRVSQAPHALLAGRGQARTDLLDRRLLGRSPQVFAVAAEAEAAHLQPAQRLLERLLERSPDGHRLADALHLRGQTRDRPRETSRRRTAAPS